MIPSHFQTEFEKIMKRDYFSSEIHPVREKAFSRFMDMGLPTQKWEDWRFTNLSELKNKKYYISDIKDAPTKPINLEKYKMEGVDTVVFYNGHYQKDISSVPEGVRLLNGIEYFERNNKSMVCAEYSPFDFLNTALMDSGFCILVEPNTIVKKPIRFLFVSNGEKAVMTNPRIDIELGQSSSLTFVEHHVGEASSYFQNESVFVNLAPNVSLDHIRIQTNSSGTINIENLKVSQEKDSQYNFFQFTNGSRFGRTNLHCELKGEGAECFLNGLTLSDSKSQIDNHIITEHISQNCTSSQNFKAILKDRSSGVFSGRVVVRKDAQKTDAKQSSKNLLLSEKAVMNSNPQLEINADDVKCAHSSTSGELDQEAIFYLRSRGLDIQLSKQLLVRGFAMEKINLIKNKPIYDHILSLFESWVRS